MVEGGGGGEGCCGCWGGVDVLFDKRGNGLRRDVLDDGEGWQEKDGCGV